MRCRLGDARGIDCGDFATIADVRRHYKDAHPGERTPNPRRRKGAAGAAPADQQAANRPASPAAPDQLQLVDDEHVDVGDEREVRPETPGEIAAQLDAEAPPGPTRLRDRLLAGPRRRQRTREGRATDASTGERVPARKGRTDTAELLGGFWGGLAWLVRHVGHDEPVGRAMAWQAPVAGALLQDFTRGKLVDHFVLQPLAENMERTELLGALLGLPIMVGLYERAPETRPFVEPLLRSAMEQHLEQMVPLMKKEQAKQRSIRKTAAQLGIVGDENDPDFDPIAVILNALFFGDEPPADAAQPEPGAAA